MAKASAGGASTTMASPGAVSMNGASDGAGPRRRRLPGRARQHGHARGHGLDARAGRGGDLSGPWSRRAARPRERGAGGRPRNGRKRPRRRCARRGGGPFPPRARDGGQVLRAARFRRARVARVRRVVLRRHRRDRRSRGRVVRGGCVPRRGHRGRRAPEAGRGVGRARRARAGDDPATSLGPRGDGGAASGRARGHRSVPWCNRMGRARRRAAVAPARPARRCPEATPRSIARQDRQDHSVDPRRPGSRCHGGDALEDPGQREREEPGLLSRSTPSSATTRSPDGVSTAT